jgi:hypothetical protein
LHQKVQRTGCFAKLEEQLDSHLSVIEGAVIERGHRGRGHRGPRHDAQPRMIEDAALVSVLLGSLNIVSTCG